MHACNIDPCFEALDIPLLTDQARTDLAHSLSMNHGPAQALKAFAGDLRCLSRGIQQQIISRLHQNLLMSPEMSQRFLWRLLLDTAESVYAERRLVSH